MRFWCDMACKTCPSLHHTGLQSQNMAKLSEIEKRGVFAKNSTSAGQGKGNFVREIASKIAHRDDTETCARYHRTRVSSDLFSITEKALQAPFPPRKKPQFSNKPPSLLSPLPLKAQTVYSAYHLFGSLPPKPSEKRFSLFWYQHNTQRSLWDCHAKNSDRYCTLPTAENTFLNRPLLSPPPPPLEG